MTQETLKFISDNLDSIGVNYEFMEWSSDVPETYFVGEYQEEESTTEDGLQESLFILTGTTSGSWLNFEQAKAKIETLFSNKTAILPVTGIGVAVFYSSSFPVPTDVDELKRIQINLKVKEWKVN